MYVNLGQKKSVQELYKKSKTKYNQLQKDFNHIVHLTMDCDYQFKALTKLTLMDFWCLYSEDCFEDVQFFSTSKFDNFRRNDHAFMWGPGVFCWSNRGWKKYLKPPQWNSVLISYLILQDGNWLLPQWLFHKLLKIFHHVDFQSPMKTPRRGCRPLQDTDVPDLFFSLFLDPCLMNGNLKGHLKKKKK